MVSLYDEQTLYYSRRLRHLFAYGGLAKQWRQTYPHLFTDQDLGLTRHGSAYLFFEWLATITLFHTSGARSLHKFHCENHGEKYETFCHLTGPRFIESFYENCKGCPDLFVIPADAKRWFFCEVKGPRDRIGPAQERMARLIRKYTRRKVVLLKFKEVP